MAILFPSIGIQRSSAKFPAVRQDLAEQLQKALREIAEHCPKIRKRCYWAGTSAIALEELRHRDSFDLDLHTLKAFVDTRPLLAELQNWFGPTFELIETPNPYGAGFQGQLDIGTGSLLTIQVMANFQDVKSTDLVLSDLVPGMRRIGLKKYLRDKLSCLSERAEARDLVDFLAVVELRPALIPFARQAIREGDELFLIERLKRWTPTNLENDLQAYPDVDPALGHRAISMLMEWLTE